MVSELSQLHLTEATYLEELDCATRVSALGDAEAYQGCLEVPRTAICLQLTEGFRESDSWWECTTARRRGIGPPMAPKAGPAASLTVRFQNVDFCPVTRNLPCTVS